MVVKVVPEELTTVGDYSLLFGSPQVLITCTMYTLLGLIDRTFIRKVHALFSHPFSVGINKTLHSGSGSLCQRQEQN